MLPNFQQDPSWMNSQNKNWHSFGDQNPMLNLNMTAVPEDRPVLGNFDSSNHAGTPSTNLDLQLSAFFPLGQQDVFAAGHTGMPQGVQLPNTVDVDAMNQSYKLLSASTNENDLSLLTKPIASNDRDQLQSSSQSTSQPNSAMTGESAHNDSKTALDSFFNSGSVADIATQKITDFYLQHKPKTMAPEPPEDAFMVQLPQGSNGGVAADAMCIRIINKQGGVEYIPFSSHHQDLASMYLSQEQNIEYPGGTLVNFKQTGPSGLHNPPSLFPPGRWAESDYAKLRDEAQNLVQQTASIKLLGQIKADLQHSLPFLQWNMIERYVSAIVKSGMQRWSLTQSRQRMALVLMLIAVSSTLFPAFQMQAAAHQISESASPWQFGLHCYRLARGLLAPRAIQPVEDELSLELVQSLILLSLYFTRCQQHSEAYSALVHGISSCLQFVQQPSVRQPLEANLAFTIFHREMIKRCMWVFFLLDRINQVESHGQLPTLFTDTIPPLEQPMLLHGVQIDDCRPDDGVSLDTISVFVSQINFAQLLGEAVGQGLLSSDRSALAPGGPLHTAALMFLQKLQRWESDTPCIVTSSNPTDPTLASWTTPSSLDLKSLYQLHLAPLRQ